MLKSRQSQFKEYKDNGGELVPINKRPRRLYKLSEPRKASINYNELEPASYNE